MYDPIVVTGIGVVSSIGIGKEETLTSLLHSRSGVGEVKYLATSHHEFPVGEVKLSDDELKDILDIPRHHLCSRTQLMGILALREALQQSQPGDRQMTLVSGTTVGGMDITERYYPDSLNGEMIDMHDCGASTLMVADYFDCFNRVTTSSTACSSALNSILFGVDLIHSGKCDMAAVGGTEAITRYHLNGFKSLMILDESPCRPFDVNRNGLNLGEGAAYLIIERESSACERHAPIIAYVSGGGNACDAFHQTASSPNGEGAFLAMSKALTEAHLSPEDISYVNAHGTGTRNNDVSESNALKRVFGQQLPPVSSTKGFTGHTTSASGSIESAFCLLALQHQFIPVNFGWCAPDPECIIPVMDVNPQHPVRHILCNAFGFGGNDSSIIYSNIRTHE